MTRPALRASAALGERMNKDEDVLVLFLTSHGSKEEGLVRQQRRPAPERPQARSPAPRARRLRHPVARDHRVRVLRRYFYQAAADRPHAHHHRGRCRAHVIRLRRRSRSHVFRRGLPAGCACPRPAHFPRRSRPPQKAIRAREKEEKLTPSNPQMYLGEAMREKLASFDTTTTPPVRTN